jgi:DNA-binding GntR family transcriptional regulator
VPKTAAARPQADPVTIDDRESDTMTARALRELMTRIRELRLEPGRAFTESELAEELELGKTPVREALLILGSQGFVVPRARSGYRVSPVTIKDARDVFAVLRALLAESAALAARRGVDANTLVALQDLDEDIQPNTLDDIRAIVSAQTRFLGIIGIESGNLRMRLQINQLLNHLARLLHLTLGSHSLRRFPNGHEAVRAALRAGDPDKAAAAARNLVDEWEMLLIDALLQSDVVLSVNVALPGGDAGGGGAEAAGPSNSRRGTGAGARSAAKSVASGTAKKSAAKKSAAKKQAPRRG